MGKIRDFLTGQALAYFVRGIGEGQYGQWAAKLYWWSAGKKTNTAMGLYVLSAALWAAHGISLCDLMAVDCLTAMEWIAKAATALAAVGLYDKAIRIDPPIRIDAPAKPAAAPADPVVEQVKSP